MPIIAKGREGWFLLLFVIQFIGWLVVTVATYPIDLGWASVVPIAIRMTSLVILTTAITIIIVEGGVMLAEQFLKRRYEEGQEKERRRWVAWLKELEDKGEKPSMPPPPPPTKGE